MTTPAAESLSLILRSNEPQELIWGIFIFCLGLCVGSFLNVCIWRIPRRKSIVDPPSHCPSCGHRIRWHENIPLLSWLCLRGRCSSCSCRISARYILVELLTGILFISIWFRVLSFRIPLHASAGLLVVFFASAMLALLAAFIDFEHFLIPNMITYPALIAGLICAPLFPELWPGGDVSAWLAFAATCASVTICGGAMALLAVAGHALFKREALGWGDVKYVAALAALLGPVACFFTLFSASIVGAVSGLVLLAVRKRKTSSPIPFGVCLAIGTILWIFAGNESVAAYLRFSKLLSESWR